MREIFILFALFLTMLVTNSCVTDGYVVYRTYPSEPTYHSHAPHGYVYVHPRPHHQPHNLSHYHPKPHHVPHHTNSPHVQPPATPPKPTSAPRATVRQNSKPSGGSGGHVGSMSGRNGRH